MGYQYAAQYAPKPNSNAFVLPKTRCMMDDAQVKLLHDLVGIRPVPQLPAQIAKKFPMHIA
jgi:hypothetical protein